MAALHSTARRGFTFTEMLLVIGIIATILCLLAPFLLKTRVIDESRIYCSWNLRQIVLGTHDYYDTFKKLPPGCGWGPSPKSAKMPGSCNGNIFFAILPYIEQAPLYKRSLRDGYYDSSSNDVWRQPVKTYICYMDPGVSQDGMSLNAPECAAGSYAFNYLVFCQMGDWNYIGSLPEIIQKGTGRTILFTEKYASCGRYGTLWDRRDRDKWMPVFAAWNAPDETLMFQSKPDPWQSNCDPTRAASPHRGGINVALADASIRYVANGVSPAVWERACDPDEKKPDDLD